MPMSRPMDKEYTGDYALPSSPQRQYRIAQRGMTESIGDVATGVAGGLIGVPLAIADSFVESFGLVDENSMEDMLKRVSPAFGDVYEQNRGAYEAIGGVAAAFIPGTLAAKAVRYTGVVGRMAASKLGPSAARMITSTGRSNQELFDIYAKRAATLRKRTHDLDKDPRFRKARNKALFRSAKDVVIEGIAADLAIAGTLHENEFLFPDEMTALDNISLGAGINALLGAGAYGIARRHLTRAINRSTRGIDTMNPFGRGVRDVNMNIAGARGAALGLYAHLGNDAMARARDAAAAGDSLAASTAQQDATAIAGTMNEIADGMMRDSPLEGFTRSIELPEQDAAKVKNTLRAAAQADPGGMSAITSVEDFAARADTFTQEFASYKAALDADVERTRATVDALRLQVTQKGGLLSARRGRRQTESLERNMRKLARLEEQQAKAERSVGIVLELDGTATPVTGRARIFQDGDRKIAVSHEASASLRFGDHDYVAHRSGRIVIKNAVAGPLELDDVTGLPRAAEPAVPKGKRRLYAMQADTTGPQRSARDGNQFFDDRNDAFEAANALSTRSRLTYIDVPESDADVLRWAKGYKLPSALAQQAKELLTTPVPLNSPRWRALAHEERTGLFDAQQSVLERMEGMSPQAVKDFDGVEITTHSHFTEMDFALEMVKRNPALAKKVRGVGSMEDLEFRSLKAKWREYQYLRNQAMESGDAAHVYNTPSNVARALNLDPGNTALLEFFEKHRVPNVIADLDTALGVRSMGQLEDALAADIAVSHAIDMESAAVLGLGDVVERRALRGNMLALPRDRKPVLAVAENLEKRAGINAEDLRTIALAQRETQFAALRAAGPDSLISATMEVVDSNKGLVTQAKEAIAELFAGNGMASWLGKAIGQQQFRFRELPGFKEWYTLTDLADKALDKRIMQKLQSTVVPGSAENLTLQRQFNRIVDPANGIHLDLVMHARHSLAQGWDVVKEGPVWREVGKNADGSPMYGIALDVKSERNRALWQKLYPGADPAMMKHLPMPTAKPGEVPEPLGLTTMARDTVEAVNTLSQALLRDENILRQARNLPPVTGKRLHMAAQNFSHKYRRFIVNDAGHLQSVASGNTLGELEQAVSKELAAARAKGHTFTALEEGSVAQYYDLQADDFFGMVDYSRIGNQTGAATGRSVGETVVTGVAAFREMVESSLRQMSDMGRRTRSIAFNPEMTYLRTMSNALATNAASRSSAQRVRNVFDELLTTMSGTQNLDPNSAIGGLLLGVERQYDRMAKMAHDGLMAGKQSIGLSGESKRAKAYSEQAKQLAERFRPWSSMEDYLARSREVTMPHSLRRHAAALNETTALLSIRMLDVGMAVINTVSLAATLPVVTRMVQRLPNETHEEHLRRVGVFATVTEGQIAIPSPAKAASDGAHFFFSDEWTKNVAPKARARGLLDQEAYEQTETFARTGESFLVKSLRDIGNGLSKATDYTERLARGLSFATFYRMGKQGLQLDDEAAMAFAHQQANNTIADFRPANRPAIYQGAAGMPLGLFTTFMWNYLQRCVDMVELKAVRAGMLQAGLQGSLFGAESLPGWPEFVEHFASNYDGSVSPADRMNTAFGHTAADVFLNGTVANIPRLFGSVVEAVTGNDLGLNDGISIGPRTAVGLPFQRGFTAQAIPGVQMMTRVATTFGKLVDSVREQNGIDPGRMAEIVATSNLNKGLANFTELVITGNMLDHRDSIIEADTRTTMGVTARILGFKPLMSDELRQENARNRATDAVRKELKQRLAFELKSLVRQGELTPEAVERSLLSYTRAGGNAESFRRFFESQVVRGAKGKAELEIAAAIRNSHDQGRLARLLYLSRD